jgi:iron-sulfur cluster assembly accessory protein
MLKNQTSHLHRISLTDRAADKLKELQQQEKKQQWGLRLAYKQGFCGKGYEYVIDFAIAPHQQDEIFYSHGFEIYVPKENMEKLQGSIIEYQDNASKDERLSALEKKGFSISNPNIKGPCPCACDRGFDL